MHYCATNVDVTFSACTIRCATLHTLDLAVDAVGEVGGHLVGLWRCVLVSIELRLFLVVCYDARSSSFMCIVAILTWTSVNYILVCSVFGVAERSSRIIVIDSLLGQY